MPAQTANAKLEMLSNVPLFASCSAKELRQVLSIVEEVSLPEGTVLVKEGAYGFEFFVVVTGTAVATRKGVELATFGPGGFFGEMALLDGGTRSATVIARTPVDLLVVDPRNFMHLVDTTPTVARAMLRTLAQRIRELEETWM